ncbi:MAG: hypothetical protein ACREOO_08010 [bacterium]
MFKAQRLAACSAILLWSCLGDVPHENPLDPGSELFVSTGSLRGQVTTFYQPYRPVRGVMLELWPSNLTTISDTAGFFAIRNAPAGEYLLYARHKNYAGDSTRVVIQQETPARVSFLLDALPQIRRVKGRTFHVNNLPPEDDVDFALFEVVVDDPDGPADVASVLMQISGINKIDTLRETSQAGVYNLELFGTDLGNGRLQSILGREISFTAVDRLGKRPEPEKLILFRIIDHAPEVSSPKDRTTADSTRPLLRWKPFSAAFAFSYSVRVERIVAGIPALVWERNNIESALASVRVDKALANVEHRWTVSVTDEFGNTSTSEPAAFLLP